MNDESNEYKYRVKPEYRRYWEWNISFAEYLKEEDIDQIVKREEEWTRESLMGMVDPYEYDPKSPFVILEGHAEYKEVTVLVVEQDRYPYPKVISGITNDDIWNILDGYMERVKLDDDVYVLLNDCGKINGMQPNRSLKDEEGNIIDVIHGPFIISAQGAFGGSKSLTKEQIDTYTERFRMCEEFMMDYDHHLISMPYMADDDPDLERQGLSL